MSSWWRKISDSEIDKMMRIEFISRAIISWAWHACWARLGRRKWMDGWPHRWAFDILLSDYEDRCAYKKHKPFWNATTNFSDRTQCLHIDTYSSIVPSSRSGLFFVSPLILFFLSFFFFGFHHPHLFGLGRPLTLTSVDHHDIYHNIFLSFIHGYHHVRMTGRGVYSNFILIAIFMIDSFFFFFFSHERFWLSWEYRPTLELGLMMDDDLSDAL